MKIKNDFQIFSEENKMKKLLIVLISLSLLLLSSCNSTMIIPDEKQCTSDDQCVAATCCHASEAVNSANAPNCQGILCTAVCEPGTLDCGQGELKCLNGGCTVVLFEE